MRTSKVTEELADAAQAVLDGQPEALTALLLAVFNYRVEQEELDRALGAELAAQEQQYKAMVDRELLN